MKRYVVLVSLVLTPLLASLALAAPRIDNVSLRGVTIGQTTRLSLQGKQLGPDPKIHLDFPSQEIRVLPESNAEKLEIEIDLPEGVPPGLGRLRVATATGISAPVTLGVDMLPNVAFRDTIDELPIALNGSLTGSQLLSTTLSGKRGQTVVVDIEAQRIGSKLQPLVSIVDERGTQLAYSSREVTLRGDARVAVKLPADGPYTIKLQDVLFKGASPGYFRMRISTTGSVDPIFPAALRLPNETEAWQNSVDSLSQAFIETRRVMANDAHAFSEPLPVILYGGTREVVESADTDGTTMTVGAVPVGIRGILSEPKQRDEFLVDVTPGTKLRAEVFAQRIHSPVDAVLEIRKPDGGILASSDDQKDTPDPAALFDVPQGVNQVKVSIHDIGHSGGPVNAYDLSITPANAADFHLHVRSPLVNVPAGGSAVLEVVAVRRGFNGPIQLDFPHLPAGVTASLAEIPAKADRALVTFTASADAKAAYVGPVIGIATAGERSITRVASVGTEPGTFGIVPDEVNLGIGIVEKPALLVSWSETPVADSLGLGQTTELSVNIQRGENQNGPVRFSLLTSQIVPQVKGKPDLSKAIQLQGDLVLKADQNVANFALSIPQQLKDIAWDVSVKGELLSDDQKQVKASATTPAVRMTLGSPVYLALTGETVIRLKGSISRAGGFSEAVTIVAEGLPKEANSTPVEIASDKTDFVIEITLPSGIPAKPLENVRLVAKSKHNGKEATSNSIAIKLETGSK